MLSSVVMQERPHLETLRDTLLESIANDLGMLRELEDKALSLLQVSTIDFSKLVLISVMFSVYAETRWPYS